MTKKNLLEEAKEWKEWYNSNTSNLKIKSVLNEEILCRMYDSDYIYFENLEKLADTKLNYDEFVILKDFIYADYSLNRCCENKCEIYSDTEKERIKGCLNMMRKLDNSLDTEVENGMNNFVKLLKLEGDRAFRIYDEIIGYLFNSYDITDVLTRRYDSLKPNDMKYEYIPAETIDEFISCFSAETGDFGISNGHLAYRLHKKYKQNEFKIIEFVSVNDFEYKNLLETSLKEKYEKYLFKEKSDKQLDKFLEGIYEGEVGILIHNDIPKTFKRQKLLSFLEKDMIVEFDDTDKCVEYFNTHDYQNFSSSEEFKQYQGDYGFEYDGKWYHINYDEAFDLFDEELTDKESEKDFVYE